MAREQIFKSAVVIFNFFFTTYPGYKIKDNICLNFQPLRKERFFHFLFVSILLFHFSDPQNRIKYLWKNLHVVYRKLPYDEA